MSVLEFWLLVGFVLTVMYYIMVHVPTARRKDFDRKLIDVHNIYSVMNEVLRDTSVERFLIFRSENGGGVPRFGYQLYFSVIYEDYRAPFRSVKEKRQGLEADGQYINMLNTVYASGWASFFTSEMPDGMLKDIYRDDGVFWAYIFKIGQDKSAFYYGSIAISQPGTPFEQGDGAKIRLAISALQSKYRKINRTWFRMIRQKLYL